MIDALNFGADLYVEKGPGPNSQFSEIVSRIKQIVTNRTFSNNEKKQCERCTTLLRNFPGMAYCRPVEPGDWMLFASEDTSDLTGHSPSALVTGGNIRYRDIIHPADRTRVERERVEQSGREGSFRLEYHIITAAGSGKGGRRGGESHPRGRRDTGHDMRVYQGSIESADPLHVCPGTRHPEKERQWRPESRCRFTNPHSRF